MANEPEIELRFQLTGRDAELFTTKRRAAERAAGVKLSDRGFAMSRLFLGLLADEHIDAETVAGLLAEHLDR